MTLGEFRYPVRGADIWYPGMDVPRTDEDRAADLDYRDNVIEQYLRELREAIGSGGGGGWTLVAKTADESVASSTTVQDDDHLQFTAENGVAYAFRIFAIVVCAANSVDWGWSMGEDTTNTRGQYYMRSRDTSPAWVDWTNSTSISATTGYSDLIAASPTLHIFDGYHVGAGGTFRLLWAQGSSNITPVIVKENSYLEYRPIA